MAVQIRPKGIYLSKRQRQREDEARSRAKEEKPWYEKYLIDPLVGVGYSALGKYVSDQMPTARAKRKKIESERAALASRAGYLDSLTEQQRYVLESKRQQDLREAEKRRMDALTEKIRLGVIKPKGALKDLRGFEAGSMPRSEFDELTRQAEKKPAAPPRPDGVPPLLKAPRTDGVPPLLKAPKPLAKPPGAPTQPSTPQVPPPAPAPEPEPAPEPPPLPTEEPPPEPPPERPAGIKLRPLASKPKPVAPKPELPVYRPLGPEAPTVDRKTLKKIGFKNPYRNVGNIRTKAQALNFLRKRSQEFADLQALKKREEERKKSPEKPSERVRTLSFSEPELAGPERERFLLALARAQAQQQQARRGRVKEDWELMTKFKPGTWKRGKKSGQYYMLNPNWEPGKDPIHEAFTGTGPGTSGTSFRSSGGGGYNPKVKATGFKYNWPKSLRPTVAAMMSGGYPEEQLYRMFRKGGTDRQGRSFKDLAAAFAPQAGRIKRGASGQAEAAYRKEKSELDKRAARMIRTANSIKNKADSEKYKAQIIRWKQAETAKLDWNRRMVSASKPDTWGNKPSEEDVRATVGPKPKSVPFPERPEGVTQAPAVDQEPDPVKKFGEDTPKSDRTRKQERRARLSQPLKTRASKARREFSSTSAKAKEGRNYGEGLRFKTKKAFEEALWSTIAKKWGLPKKIKR